MADDGDQPGNPSAGPDNGGGDNDRRDGLLRNVRDQGGATVADVVGSVDFENATALRDALAGVIRDRSPERLVLDMSGVPYMGSAGWAALVEAVKSQRKNGGTLRLASLVDEVRSIMEIGRLDKLFAPAADVDAAVNDAGGAKDADGAKEADAKPHGPDDDTDD